MPGLVGFSKNNLTLENVGALLRKMAGALESEDRFKACLYHEEGLGLGRVCLDFACHEPQPVWNKERTVCALVEGELYNRLELREWLVGRGHRPEAGSDAEVVLGLYEETSEDFASRLNGAFLVAIWDQRSRKLLLINDRLGLFPLYYAEVNNGLLFASGVRSLLADPDLSRSVDRVAINQFLVLDHLLDDRTLLAAVRLLPQASLLTFTDGHLHIRPYWKLQYPDHYEDRSEEVCVDQLIEFLRRAVTRQAPNGKPSGMLLSGGMDSRILLAMLRDGIAGGSFHTFTWGIPGCDDARYAGELATRLGTRHEFLELRPDWLRGLANEAVRITDGMANVVNLHALATLEKEAQSAQVLYKGFLGDALLGFALKRQMWADYDEATQWQVHLKVHNSHGVVNYTRDEQSKLFTDAFQSSVGEAVYETYRDGMTRSGVSQLANQRLYFDLTQRVPRMTVKGVEVVRSRALVRLPFCDNELLDFVLTVPPGFLFERHLMKAALIKSYPELAKIPVAGTCRPMIPCARDLWIQTRSLLAWHLNKAGLGWLAGVERRPYKDYNNWFRTSLRQWVEELLLSERAMDRGYFNPDSIRSLVAEHMAGKNYAVRLGAMATIELWHRQFLD